MPKRSGATMRERGTHHARTKASPANSKRMPYREVPEFLRALRNDGSTDAAKDALEWLILTVTRTTEALGARLAEVSEKTATWTVPAERASDKRKLVVALSARALEIFSACKKRHNSKGDLIFEAKPGQPLSSMAMLMQMRRFNSAAVPHGFRYSFAAWASDHTDRQYEGAKASPKNRRTLIDDWSAFCTGKAPRHKRRGSRAAR